MTPTLSQLQEKLGYSFSDSRLLLEALTHPSFAAENDGVESDNQRLEFYGDAIIQLIMTRRIFGRCPDWGEGRMTKLRAIFTRQSTLATMARHLDLGSHLRIGRGERLTEGANRPSNLCDAFEALCAAIYMDAGQHLEPVADLVNRLIDEIYPDAEGLLDEDNPKGALQEYAQQHFGSKPIYETREIVGPDHLREFTVAVYLDNREFATGTGGKRQKAEQEAARAALERLLAEGEGV